MTCPRAHAVPSTQVSEGLAELLGTGGKPIARSEITKRMWAYFKSNNLIDPSNKK